MDCESAATHSYCAHTVTYFAQILHRIAARHSHSARFCGLKKANFLQGVSEQGSYSVTLLFFLISNQARVFDYTHFVLLNEVLFEGVMFLLACDCTHTALLLACFSLNHQHGQRQTFFPNTNTSS